jgi:hypothetical protein
MWIRWSLLGFLHLYNREKRIVTVHYVSPEENLGMSEQDSSLDKLLQHFLPSIKKPSMQPIMEGYDTRPNMTNEVVFDIYKFRRQMDLLNYLENNTTSQSDKLARIELYNRVEERSQYVGNITNGGLFKEWLNSTDE